MRHILSSRVNRWACARAIAVVFLCAGAVTTLNQTTASAQGRGGATITSIQVSPVNPSVDVGTTQQFEAMAKMSNGTTQNITATATWQSSNVKDATIQTARQAQPGLATGVAAGSVTITASSSGKSGATTLDVISGSGGGGSATKIPLMDMTASETYQGFAGGLYENSSDTVPADHGSAGKSIAATVQPLDSTGKPNANGKIVFLSIGMSNAYDEFGFFMNDAAASASVNHKTLVIAEGALPGATAPCWLAATGPGACDGDNQYDRVLQDVLTPLGVTQEQVQVVWLNEADSTPGVDGCGASGNVPCQPLCNDSAPGCSDTVTTTEALRYEAEAGDILRAAKTRWPNLKLAFISSRIYAGYATIDLNPEPYAYEYGFSAKWLIEAQVIQARNGFVDPTGGDLGFTSGVAPWIAWGPYTWANGAIPRSDGLIWCDGQPSAPCKGEVDYQKDGTHPNPVGAGKVATMMMNFFLGSPYTASWFAAP